MTSTTASVLRSYVTLADRFGAVVDRLGDDGWGRSSVCEGWTARDVLDHVVTTQCDFLDQHAVDATTAPDAASSPRRVWHDHDDRMRELLADPGVAGLAYDGLFGATTVGESIIAFYGFDLIVHRWDIAEAAGLDEGFSDEELDTVEASADGFGVHLYGEGICKPAVPVPYGADRQTALLARLGRRTRAIVE